VTVVDASVFLDLFGSDENILTHSKLAVGSSDDAAKQRLEEDGTGMRRVTELLLEQVECADHVLVNKVDLLKTARDLELVKRVIASVNPGARVFTCTNGQIDPQDVVGTMNGLGAADAGILDEHRKLVQSVENAKDSHEHSHDHGSECTSTQEGHVHDENCGHGHEHSHDHGSECTSTQEGHVHDENCGHGHEHSHSHSETTAEVRFGITSFVYRRRKPFHPTRLSLFFRSLGTLSIKGVSDLANMSGERTDKKESSDELHQAQKRLLRSKGFVWMATSSAAAYFMSHAGQVSWALFF
jgi:G3E family GTPase